MAIFTLSASTDHYGPPLREEAAEAFNNAAPAHPCQKNGVCHASRYTYLGVGVGIMKVMPN